MEGKKRDCWFKGIAFISILYFIATWAILIMNLWYSPPSPKLGLNEIGDYLAGAFSPLAFFWLAYGYWMQNRELRSNNTHQSESLDIANNQLILQKNMINFESMKKFNESQAFFKISHLKTIDKKIVIEIKNHNNEVYDFTFGEYSEDGKIPISFETILKNEPLEIEISLNETLDTSKKKENHVIQPFLIHKERFYIEYTDKFEINQEIEIGVSSFLTKGKNITYHFNFQNIRTPLPEVISVY